MMICFLIIQVILAFYSGTVTSSTTEGTAYTKAEQQEIVDAHNNYRTNVDPPATNMLEMEWDQELAAQAQLWADRCVFAHPNKKEHPDYVGIGQNVFMRGPDKGGDSPPGTVKPTDAWYNEVRFYNISSDKCDPGRSCGHYTQVVWAKTEKVGCGIKFCPELLYPGKSKTMNNIWLVVCNYSPPGNYKGKIPYIIGNPCSECRDGKLCKNNLCTDCSADEEGCECKLECKNCGTTDPETCQCSCPDGYSDEHCETYCQDKSPRCGNGYKKRRCHVSKVVDRKCPLMCGICTPGPVVDPTNC